jgi:hypothetical protein
MLKVGFDVDDANICCTSLHIASVNGDVERVEWLIRNGATTTTRCKRCLFPPICLGTWTPRDLAALSLSRSGQDVNLLLKDAEDNPRKYLAKSSREGLYSHAPGNAQQEAILAELTEKMEVTVPYGAEHTPLQLTRCLVLRRIKVVGQLFPTATKEQMVEALQFYSPESRLQDLTGFTSKQGDGQGGKWQTFQGELFYGSDQQFHDGVSAVIGEDLSESMLGNAVEIDCLAEGRMEDCYNLWYFKYCPARQQRSYNEQGEVRLTAEAQVAQAGAAGAQQEGKLKLVDCGNEGKRLADFTANINELLKEGGSSNVVTDEQVSPSLMAIEEESERVKMRADRQ